MLIQPATPAYAAVLAVDPDSTHTAYCLALRYGDGAADAFHVIELNGGGNAQTSAVPWGSVTGARVELSAALSAVGGDVGRLTLVVEAQTPEGAFSSSVEGCRRARWHWDAAAELEGIERVHAMPADWESVFVPADSEWIAQARPGKGRVKRAYRARARDICGNRASNEDRAAAVGLAWWWCREQGARLLG